MRQWVCTAGLLTLAAAPSWAQSTAGIERPEDIGAGTLALAWQGQMIAAPVLESEYSISIGGMLARTELTQTFENTTGEWIEGIYVYPLPDGAQVDYLELVIGDRRIVGEIHERRQARAEYEAARAQGRRAGLLESERPNLFTTNVANVGPGQRISVRIAWQHTVRYDDGRFVLRLPLVAAPRYVPGEQAARNPVDAGRINPIRRSSAQSGPNRVRLRARLDAGAPVSDVRSLYHEITQRFVSAVSREIELAYADTSADRDFVLEWRTAPAQPVASVFREWAHGSEYALLQFFPPPGMGPPRLSRDIVFVIDTSGSMDGTSIEQARQALLFALQRLTAGDRFNVIRFASDTQALFDSPVEASADRVREAAEYVRSLSSGGGTEMFHAVNAALRQFSDAASQRVRQVVFMTDGNVGNERVLFDLIRQLLGNTRLYTVGIGSAPNSYFMASAARFGRGTHTFIGDVSEVSERMTALFEKIAAPVLTDIEIDWPDGAVREVYPRRIGDLFAGEPLLVAIRGSLPATFTVSGRVAGAPWSRRVSTATAAELPGTARYWASRRIASLLDEPHRREPGDPTYDAIVETALAHAVVSRYTSLLAVDTAPARSIGQPYHTRTVPIELPAGWRASSATLRLPATATSARLYLALGLAVLCLTLGVWLSARRMPCAA
jgi:Ca-activated chloride channel family protein